MGRIAHDVKQHLTLYRSIALNRIASNIANQSGAVVSGSQTSVEGFPYGKSNPSAKTSQNSRKQW